MSLQYRIAPEGQVRDVDESKREVLVSFPWEVIDSYNTDFSREAFDEHLRQSLPIMVWQHVRSEPIGRAKEWQKTQHANEFVAGFSDFDAVPRARQAFTQVRDKELTDFSYGFDRAKSSPHPDVRGAVRFSQARMAEISPVSVGSIPGAVAIGIRAEAEIANIRGLIDAGAISEDEGWAMLRDAGVEPPAREQVTVTTDPLGDAIRVELTKAGERDLLIRVGSDGTVTSEPDTTGTDDGADDDEDVSLPLLLQAVDGALDQAEAVLAGADVNSWPTDAQTVAQLVVAASSAIDSALEEAGIPDSDEQPEQAGETAAAEGDERAGQKPHGDVEYADPGYQADKQKRYPVDTAEHVKAALAYTGQADNAAKYSADDLATVKAKIAAAAKKFGIKVSDEGSGKRDADEVDVTTQVALARMNLTRR